MVSIYMLQREPGALNHSRLHPASVVPVLDLWAKVLPDQVCATCSSK